MLRCRIPRLVAQSFTRNLVGTQSARVIGRRGWAHGTRWPCHVLAAAGVAAGTVLACQKGTACSEGTGQPVLKPLKVGSLWEASFDGKVPAGTACSEGAGALAAEMDALEAEMDALAAELEDPDELAAQMQEVSPFLMHFLHELIPDAKSTDRVLLPFCGIWTINMAFLASRGLRVVGFDYVANGQFDRSPNSIQEFASQCSTTGATERIDLPTEVDPKRFRAHVMQTHSDSSCTAPPVSIVEGDLLSITASEAKALIPFGAAFDPGALVVMDEEGQTRYAQALTHLIEPGGRVLMLSVQNHAEKSRQGPPNAPNLQQLFGEAFEVRLLHKDEPDGDESLQSRGQHGCVYLLTKR